MPIIDFDFLSGLSNVMNMQKTSAPIPLVILINLQIPILIYSIHSYLNIVNKHYQNRLNHKINLI